MSIGSIFEMDPTAKVEILDPVDWLESLQPGSMSMSGFWEGPPLPSAPRRRRIEIKLDRHRPAFVTYAHVVDDAYGFGFTLTGAEARRYARYYSPKFQARLRRLHSSYPRRWRKR